MKKILLTGANGFIGRNIKEQFRDIYCMDAPSHQELDLKNQRQVCAYLKNGKYDVIIHSANVNTTRNRSATEYDSLKGNLKMFYNLETCHEYYGKMLYFGSGAEYDMTNYIPDMKESFRGQFIPEDPYGFSKYIMSRQTEHTSNVYELILFGVYGKYEEWERRFISNAICRMLCGLPITISRNVYFDYLWIDDLVNIICWFIENEPRYKRYNVCSGQKADLLSIAERVREIGGSGCDIQVGEPGLKREYTGDNTRLLEEIGEFRFTGFDEGIRKLISYYRENIVQIKNSDKWKLY